MLASCSTDSVPDNDDGPPPFLGDPETGVGWYAHPPEGYVEPPESYEVEGTVIRFMPEDSVSVPLWDGSGLLPHEPEWLNRALGLSPELVADLAAWGDDWNASIYGQQFTAGEHRARAQRLDAEAQVLIGRLRAELPEGYTVVYRP